MLAGIEAAQRLGDGSQRGTGLGPGEERQIGPVIITQHDFAHVLGECGEQRLAQLAAINPGAGSQLELLGEPPGKGEAGFGTLWLMEHRQVARAVISFFIKNLRVLFRVVQIALHHIGAAKADLVASVMGHKLDLKAGGREADADLVGGKVDDHAAGDGFGHAIAGGHVDAVAGLGDGKGLQLVMDVLRQAGAAVEHQPHVLEKAAAQLGIIGHRLHQHGIAGGHVIEISHGNLT